MKPALIFLGLLACLSRVCLDVRADTLNSLQPIDTSSPRQALLTFNRTMDEGYRVGIGRLKQYLASSRTYPTRDEMNTFLTTTELYHLARRAIDFSELPKSTAEELARLRTLQLKDVLEHIELPPLDQIPDQEAMSRSELKRWTIPGTEIRIVRIESGPRLGEYLFSADTVSRLPEMYELARQLPYKDSTRINDYEIGNYSPVGLILALPLDQVIPTRWLLYPPDWTMVRFLDQPVWRWMGILLTLGLAALTYRQGLHLIRYWFRQYPQKGLWIRLLRPVILILIVPIAEFMLGKVLRVTGEVGRELIVLLWTVYYLALTWLVWGIGSALSASVIRAEQLLPGSIDSQFVRLMLRLLTIICVIAILIVGSDRVGLPSYSVLAGLGVGGLAVALAGQQTLANLLGSIIIMVEKPFALGDFIKVNQTEGVVEDVGFRSTRIRTTQNSVVTIPSNQMVNSTIDNLTRRFQREVRTTLNITYDTPNAQVEEFIQAVRQMLLAHPKVDKELIQVFVNDFGSHSLVILVKFMLNADDLQAEYSERHRLLLDIKQIAEDMGVQVAFPTQTLHVETLPVSNLT